MKKGNFFSARFEGAVFFQTLRVLPWKVLSSVRDKFWLKEFKDLLISGQF
jgi:hypothetical protein